MKKNKLKIRKIITFTSTIVLSTTLISVIILFIIGNLSFYSVNDEKLIDYNSYNGNQVYIKDSQEQSNNDHISISNVSSNTDCSEKIITIATAEELDKFSSLCNSNDNFLAYNYKLLCNIDFDEYTQNDFIPIGWNNKSFSGSFDGQGYEIRNLEFININSSNASSYSKMTYFSMFSKVSGSIKNFGLVDPVITIASLIETMIQNGGVSYIVGENTGTVENVFVRSLSTTLLDECGITAAGGYRIAGLCVVNGQDGKINNSYIATNSLYNYTLTDVTDYAEIAISNYGTIENCYFYNSCIDDSSTQTTNGQYKFIYSDDSGFVEKEGAKYYGTLKKSLAELNTAFSSLNWTVSSDPTDENILISDYYSNETPINRKFSESITYSNKIYTININNVNDYLFMYECMNGNNYFASNAIKYVLKNNLDLNGIPATHYSYSSGFGATFEGEKIDSSKSLVTLINGNKSIYPTIINAEISNPIRMQTMSGIDAYGLFPYLIGTIKNINIIADIDMTDIAESQNVKAIGAVSGYSEAGIINNVNVKITANLESTDKIGEYYLGGITGILGGEGLIKSSTTSGSFNLIANANYTSNSSYMGGISIGGVVGYIEDSLGCVSTCLNAINITSGLGNANATYAIGGVIGAGYTTDYNVEFRTEELENLGKIIVGVENNSSGTVTYSATSYSNLYLAGVIGRHLGETKQIQMLVNQGEINLCGSSSATLTMIAGVENADIRSSAINNTGVTASQYKNKNGNTLFYASSLTNRADIKVLSQTSNIIYTSVLNISSSNNVKSVISKLFNLNNNNVYPADSIKRRLLKIDDFDIDSYYANTYAACLNAVSTTNENDVTVDTIYNLRNINYINSSAVVSNLKYSALVLGDNVTITHGKNEGNIKFNYTNNITGNITSVGIIDNVGESSSLYDVYNGGDMTLDCNILITGDVYFSGICYSNNHVYSANDLEKFNPLSDNYDSSAVGAIDNVINKGTILVTNSNAYSMITFTPVPVFNEVSSNKFGNTVIGEDYRINNRPNNIIKGNIFITGITAINKSVINNSFNLGNLTGVNYAVDSKDSNNLEINVSGFSIYNISNQSYILNSANNGTIKAINLYGKEKNAYKKQGDFLLDEYSTWADCKNINASGISIRNDKCLNNNGELIDYFGGNNHSQQIISFTINYGSIFAYSNGMNITSSELEPACKASGILAMGLCNVINTVNYGNIYGSESAAGIFGVVYFSKFKNDVNYYNKVNIANSINYGNIYQIDKGQNAFRYTDSFRATYEELKGFNDENINSINKEETVYTSLSGDISDNTIWGIITNCNTNKNSGTAVFAKTNIESPTSREYWTGSIFSLVNFANDENAKNIVIRYLISFNTEIPIEGNESGYSAASSATDVSKIYSSYHKIEGGIDLFSKYMGKQVTYSPLSTDNEIIGSNTYVGVFNKEFVFRKAIEGDNTVLDANIASDKLLSDYFEFVVYNKINEKILDKIGWRSMAYSNAATLFATNLSNIKVYYDTYSTINENKYKDDLSASLSVGTWVVNSETSLLMELVEKYTTEKTIEELTKLMEYIFSNDCMYSTVVNNEFRANIIKYLVDNNYSDFFDQSLINFTKGYAKVLASTLCDNTNNDIYEKLSTNLEVYIESVGGITKQSLLLAYASYLSSDGNDFFNDTSKYIRYDLLKDIFSSVNNDDFYNILYNVFSEENKSIIDNEDINTSIYSSYSQLTQTDKISLFKNIISYNDETVIEEYLNAFATDINLFAELNYKYSGYNIVSFDDILDDSGSVSIKTNNTSTTDIVTINNRIDLWNKIRSTTTFKNYLSDIMNDVSFIEHATEHKNTWMSNTGKEIGEKGEAGNFANYSAIKVEDISSDTIFFGPYKSDGTVLSTPTIYPKNGMINKTNADIYKLDNDVSDTSKFYLSIVMTTDSKIANDYNSSGYTYKPYSFIYDYGGDGGKNQIDGESVLVKATSDLNATYLKENTTIKFSDSSNNSIEITTIKGAWIGQFPGYADKKPDDNVAKKVSFYDGNTKITKSITYKTWYDLVSQYAIKYYIAVPTTKMHLTQMSGLYMNQAPWKNLKINYFIPSQLVYTTHYIEYTVDDLLQVDGKCTVEANNSTEHERRIINTIFETYLLNKELNRAKFSKIVKKALFESVGIDSTSFVDSIITTSIGESISINNTSIEVLKYLVYNSTTNAETSETTSTSVYDYLYNLQASNKKEQILVAAASNKDVFCELLFLLFDTTLTSGADEDWEPSPDWGGSLDVTSIYNRMKYMSSNSWETPSINFPSDINSGSHPNSGSAIPFVISNEISNDYYSSNTEEQVNINNIGYYTGNGAKIYSKDTLNNTYPSDLTIDSNKVITDLKIWTKTSSTSGSEYDIEATVPNNIKKAIVKNLNYSDTNGRRLYGIRLNTQVSNNNPVTISSLTIAGKTYYGTSYLPANAVWFVPQYSGKVKIALAVLNNGTQGFTLYKISRNNNKTDNDNPYSATISNTTPISEIKDNDNNIIFNENWCREMTEKRIYYYEIPVEAGVEYALGQANSNGSYLIYIDLGQNGSSISSSTQTNYIQKQFADYANNALNKFIPYLTPLQGGTASIGDNKIYIPASSYDSLATYYQRTGKGTTTNPYVFSEVTSGVTSANCDKYYVDSGKTISNYQNQVFNKDFIIALSKYSNEMVVNLVKKIINSELTDAEKKHILEKLTSKSVENSYLIFNSIILDFEINSSTKESTLTPEFRKWLVSGYLATDYYHHLQLGLSLANTRLDEELPDLNDTKTSFITNSDKCDYIDGNGNIIPENFERFKIAIGLSYADDGYGIFALASGKGIQNGTFIPDNLDLSSMDPYYNLKATDDESKSIISLTYDSDPETNDLNDSWRKDFVNNAFNREMKQLKLSISTTIFELDLNYSETEVLYAGTNEITSDTITYYVPQTYINNLKTKNAVSINNIVKAESASFKTNNNNETTIDFTKLGVDNILKDAIVVTAEDTSIVKKYSIILVPTEVSFNIESIVSDTSKINYSGGKATLTITTTNMPNGFNFSSFLSVSDGNNTLSDKWDIDDNTINNGVVVLGEDNNGTATLVVNVYSSMPGGTLTFTISAFGTNDTISIEKIKNNEAIIKSFKFEGSDLTNTINNSNSVESYILFGRAYDYSELTDFSSKNFYLYEFKYSDNATVVISAVIDAINDYRIQYIVTYTIKSEDEKTTNTFTHYLIEKDFFDSTYANLYRDGISQSDSNLYTIAFSDGDAQLNDGTNNSSLNYDPEKINFIAVAYNRGISPEYRIKYNLSNFYTLGDVIYSYKNSTNANTTSITQTYRGLTVSVSDSFEPGVYKYEYVYTSKGTWINEENADIEYSRIYTFPAIYIVKLLSTDALLNRLTFIDSSIVLGNTATVMKTNTLNSTSIIQDKNGSTELDGYEVTYNSLFTSNSREIEIKGKNIVYGGESASTDISDYYAIGTVSDSDLTYYCPTFGIESHAQIYQYTTLNKLQSYGENQTDSDSSILTDHNDIFLYVPFVSGNEVSVFLVKLDSNGNWKAVYDTNYNGITNTSDPNYNASYLIYTYNNSFNTKAATTENSTVANFAVSGKTYSVSSVTGKTTNNQSLYMDYIGNPLENHFWYVSYLVFSESALNGDYSKGNIRYYHISIIDATNTVYFDVTLYAPSSLANTLDSLYLTISENIYNELGVKTSSQQISGYLNKTDEVDSETGLTKYLLSIRLQTLPKGYFYFYIDLPQGYTVTAKLDMVNQLDNSEEPGKIEVGSFLPFTSIIPKTIKLDFIVSEGENGTNASWGVSTTDIVSVKAKLE